MVHVDGLEAAGPWITEEWANSATAQVVSLQTDVDNKILQVEVRGMDKEKAAIRHTASTGRLDLSSRARLTFDVYLEETNAPVRVAVAFVTMPGWQFFESTQSLVRPDKRWTPITVDLTAQNFKCEATNWRYESSIENKSNVQQIIFLIYNSAPCKVYIDNVFLTGGEELPAAP